KSAAAVKPDADGSVPPRALVESGAWSPGPVAPRPEPGKSVRIGDRFKPGDRIPVPAQYMCTVCRFRKHSRQMLEENADGRFAAEDLPYEPEMVPRTGDRRRFAVSFYLTAMLFIIFDVEAIFICPWAVIVKGFRWFGVIEKAVFAAILLVALIYA